MKKRILGVILTLTMIMGVMPGFKLAVSATTNLTDSTTNVTLIPDAKGFYQIGTANDLFAFANLVNAGNTSINAILTADITVNTKVLNTDGSLVSDVSGLTVWTPIGNSAQKYAGTFDGNNKTVSGLYIDKYATSSSSDKKYISFFGYVNNGTVKNVTVRDSFFAGYEWVGGIAGCFWGRYGYMENCVSYASVKGHQNIGGVAGGIQYASATNCHNYGLVTGSNMTGGFMGKTGYSSVFTNCSNTGNVKWISGSAGYFGGFVADASGGQGTTRAKFVNCFNSGDIIYEAENDYDNRVGGFVCNANGTYENCYSNGSITVPNATDKYKVGGFGASAYSNLTITNCYYDSTKVSYGAMNSGEYSGVSCKTTEQFASGEITYLLNGSSSDDGVIWKQTLATDKAPNFDGLTVYYDGTKYYNVVPEATLTLTKDNVTIENLFEDAILVVASYKNKVMVDVKMIPVSGDVQKSISSTGLDISDYHEIRAFLWKDLVGLKPLCEGDVYDKTTAFDGEWIAF